jgi:hypothetical protein
LELEVQLKWEKQETIEQFWWADILEGRIGKRRNILIVVGEIGF